MFEEKDTTILIYGVICLGLGGMFSILGRLSAPTYQFGFGITSSHHYQFLPTGLLYLLGGSFLLCGIVAPILYIIVKLVKKLKT